MSDKDPIAKPRPYQNVRRGRGGFRTALRQLANLFLLILIVFCVYQCYRMLFIGMLWLLEAMQDSWASIGRQHYTVFIRRLGADLRVAAQIDSVKEVSYVSASHAGPGGCLQKETVKDFEKGIEVFTYGSDCFVRFYNQSEEGYTQQMNLFRQMDILQGVPLVQTPEPTVMQAVNQLQFSERLYVLMGRWVAQVCHMRRLFWLFPASPTLASHLTACRCVDTLHARLHVCKEKQKQAKKTPRTGRGVKVK